eukprot:10294278-Alexandrium_andersonii.AAC.1
MCIRDRARSALRSGVLRQVLQGAPAQAARSGRRRPGEGALEVSCASPQGAPAHTPCYSAERRLRCWYAEATQPNSDFTTPRAQADRQWERRAQQVLSAIYQRRIPTSVFRALREGKSRAAATAHSRARSTSRRSGWPASRSGCASARRRTNRFCFRARSSGAEARLTT